MYLAIPLHGTPYYRRRKLHKRCERHVMWSKLSSSATTPLMMPHCCYAAQRRIAKEACECMNRSCLKVVEVLWLRNGIPLVPQTGAALLEILGLWSLSCICMENIPIVGDISLKDKHSSPCCMKCIVCTAQHSHLVPEGGMLSARPASLGPLQEGADICSKEGRCRDAFVWSLLSTAQSLKGS